MTAERFPGRFTLDGHLRALTALRVGAPWTQRPVGTDLPVLRDALGDPYIPGSTLKGALRAAAERLVRTVRPGPRHACFLMGGADERCIPPARLEQLRRASGADPGRLAEALGRETCWVCQVFGAPWLASRVACADLPVAADTWLGHFQVRDGVAIDRDTETAGAGLKYDYEVVPAGVEFRCQLQAETDVPWQLGLLALAVRELEEGRLALGSGRSRGLGRVVLVVVERRLVSADADSLLRYLADPREAAQPVDSALVQSWVAALLDCLRADALPAEAG